MVNVIDNKVDARDIHIFLELKTPFHKWIKRSLDYTDAKQDIDFWTKKSESTGGRRSTYFLLSIDCAKEICLVQPNQKSKQLRRWLIKLSNKRENLDLVTAKEAAFAVKIINALKYIENQKEVYYIHQKKFIEKEGFSKFIYADFARYRARIVGWDKGKVDQKLNEYLLTHAGYNKSKLYKKSMSDKLSVIDINEAIRVSVLDILFSKESDEGLSYKFASFVKKMAKELDIEPLSKNETNLFQNKEQIDITNLMLGE